MNIAPAVSQWLSTEFPRPRVDPEWAQQCYDWLITEENLSPETDLQRIKDEMRTQILLSDLRDSMLQGTGIPTQSAGSNFSGFMGVKEHVLVQITSITDIGVSAFHLDQTRVAREERFQKGAVEGEEDGDVEVDEGPVPKYQRGMLAFQLTDGALNLEAIEYRPLQDFRLGETKLGLKLRLKNPLIRRGQVFLEPKNVEIVGGHTDELEEQQSFKFKRSLYKRLR
ncbi:hypothetical protein DL96DRAFT_1465939 [Flagelloscypha sp. PMI_526]|nr:hypothetical protein DL96DRAFT_1465939 [Flagelloscypha sp. PMI_526]